jgi:hypothetical protein
MIVRRGYSTFGMTDRITGPSIARTGDLGVAQLLESVKLRMSRRRDLIDTKGREECRERRCQLVCLARSKHVQQVKPRDDRGPVAHQS